MTTSQEQFLSEVLKADPIATEHLYYFRERLRTKLHQLVLREFLRQEKAKGLTRKELALRVGRAPEQITRWLGAPGNWTIDTVSDLMLGMGAEIDFRAVPLVQRMGESPSSYTTSSTQTTVVANPPLFDLRSTPSGFTSHVQEVPLAA